MLLSWNGAYESKELHKMEEAKEKETNLQEKMKLSTIRIVVISETCLLIIRRLFDLLWLPSKSKTTAIN